MKKRLLGASLLALSLTLAACSSEEPKKQEEKVEKVTYEKVEVQVNGLAVGVDSYLIEGKPYVSVDAYKNLYKGELAGVDKVVTKDVNGVKYAEVEALSKETGGDGYIWEEENKLAYVLDFPTGVIQLSPEIPGHGAHWANPAEMMKNGGPLYGTLGGKFVFVEYEAAPEFFKGRQEIEILPGETVQEIANIPAFGNIPQAAINHVDHQFLAKGHEGMKFSHYAIHAYVIGHEEHMATAGNHEGHK